MEAPKPTQNIQPYETLIEINKNIFNFHIEYKTNGIIISIEVKNNST